MKHILQNLKTGETALADIPCPAVKRGQLLIRTRQTLVSAGTERMLVEFGKANLLDKARQQPDKVRLVLDKVKTDGLLPTLEAVRHKLDQSLPMGYCNVGTVLEVGGGVSGFQAGDRVASNGKHAEAVSVPVTLCARVPEAVSDEAAAFTVVGAIALQGIRLLRPTLGEAVVVTGLGLIGLLTVQLLRAHGCAELEQIIKTYTTVHAQHPAPLLMVGFNRRFAPQIRRMKALLAGVRAPKSLVMTVNAGEMAPDHWTQSPQVGGGRIIGEGCHFIDLLRFLVGHPISGVQTTMVGAVPGVAVRADKMSFTLAFTDGSFGTVHYLANGHKSLPKERLEVFCGGRVLQLENFRRLRGYGWPGFKRMHLWRQDKGHKAEVAAFIQAVQDGTPSPIPFEELVEVTRVSFAVMEAALR